MNALHSIGFAWATSNHLIQAPSSGGTFTQNGLAYGLAKVPAGTYKLPDNGLPMFVQATGTATIQSQAAVTVARLEANTAALCIPQSNTAWAAVFLRAGAGPESLDMPDGKFTTSATATSVTPAAGALTGARHVVWENTADGALEVTTRTGAQLFDDISGAFAGLTYWLTIVNRGNNTVTLTGGEDVTVNGENTIATLTTRTYLVTFAASSAATMQSVNKGTIET